MPTRRRRSSGEQSEGLFKRLTSTCCWAAQSVAPAIVVLLLSASTLPAQVAQAANITARQHPGIYVEIKGAKSGSFPGDVLTGPHKGEIVALSLAYGMEISSDPRTGVPNGKRVHKPVVFTHDVSAATPDLFEALAKNETLATVTITFGANYTLTLTNAHVTALRQFNEENLLVEEVTLTFQKIDLKAGTHTATDNWVVPSM